MPSARPWVPPWVLPGRGRTLRVFGWARGQAVSGHGHRWARPGALCPRLSCQIHSSPEHVIAHSGTWLHADKRENSGGHSKTRPSTEPGQETLPPSQTWGRFCRAGVAAPVQLLDHLDQVPWGSVDTWVPHSRPERFHVRAQAHGRARTEGPAFVPKQPRSTSQSLRALSLGYQTAHEQLLASRHNVPISRQCGKNHLTAERSWPDVSAVVTAGLT